MAAPAWSHAWIDEDLASPQIAENLVKFYRAYNERCWAASYFIGPNQIYYNSDWFPYIWNSFGSALPSATIGADSPLYRQPESTNELAGLVTRTSLPNYYTASVLRSSGTTEYVPQSPQSAIPPYYNLTFSVLTKYFVATTTADGTALTYADGLAPPVSQDAGAAISYNATFPHQFSRWFVADATKKDGYVYSFPGYPSGPVRKYPREISSLLTDTSETPTSGHIARFIASGSGYAHGSSQAGHANHPATPTGERVLSGKFYVGNGTAWLPADPTVADADIITDYGLVRTGDIFGPWILNQWRDVMNLLGTTLVHASSIPNNSAQVRFNLGGMYSLWDYLGGGHNLDLCSSSGFLLGDGGEYVSSESDTVYFADPAWVAGSEAQADARWYTDTNDYRQAYDLYGNNPSSPALTFTAAGSLHRNGDYRYASKIRTLNLSIGVQTAGECQNMGISREIQLWTLSPYPNDHAANWDAFGEPLTFNEVRKFASTFTSDSALVWCPTTWGITSLPVAWPTDVPGTDTYLANTGTFAFATCKWDIEDGFRHSAEQDLDP